jgi:hypothetical protein
VKAPGPRRKPAMSEDRSERSERMPAATIRNMAKP